jgi:hypothetical protein
MPMIIHPDDGITFPDTSVQAKAVPAAPQSMVRLSTTIGYGSTNTCIRRYSNVITNQGADITYADSVTLGASFTINTNGVYAITVTGSQAITNSFSGASLNAAAPASSILLATTTERLCMVPVYTANALSSAGWTGYLAAGSIVRPHDDGQAASASGLVFVAFTITRVA